MWISKKNLKELIKVEVEKQIGDKVLDFNNMVRDSMETHEKWAEAMEKALKKWQCAKDKKCDDFRKKHNEKFETFNRDNRAHQKLLEDWVGVIKDELLRRK